MQRRDFLTMAAWAAATTAARPRWAAAQEPTGESGPVDVDPYFLEPGDLSGDEQARITEFEQYLEMRQDGRPSVMPRGGRPPRAPTYRVLHWQGDLGAPDGRLVGPLSVRPALESLPAYRFNAQILGFNAASADWKSKAGRGTLTVEMRGRYLGEPMTWLFAQQFDLYENGTTNLGFEYVAQRDGVPDPVITDEPNLDLRVQLMRHGGGGGGGGLLRKVLGIASSLVGLPLAGAGGGALQGLAELLPPLRVPKMVQEGVAFSQALFGTMADEKPLWRSGFNSYSLSAGGSRLRLAPGFWVFIDEQREPDLSGVVLEDLGGRVALTRGGQPLDANYLVLAAEIGEADPSFAPGGYPADGYEDYALEESYEQELSEDGQDAALPRGVIPKGESKPPPKKPPRR